LGQITWFAAQAKVGKTTFLSALVSAVRQGEFFCGLKTCKSAAIYISEEAQYLWSVRINNELIPADTLFQCCPFAPSKPTLNRWVDFVGGITRAVQDHA
jgi:hypothetical protein